MLFSVDDKHLIKVLREEKQYTACEFFLKKIPEQGGLNNLLEKVDKFVCVERLAGT